MKTDAFGAYKIYLALKLHFTTSYDAVKYNFKTKADPEKFRNSPQAWWYHKLSERYDFDQIKEAFVAQFIEGVKWGGVRDPNFDKTYIDWKKRHDALQYTFRNDLELMWHDIAAGSGDPILADLFTPAATRPWVVVQWEKKRITLETLVILDKLTNFTVKCGCTDTILWPLRTALIHKYSPFVSIDRPSYKTILLKQFPLAIGETSGQDLESQQT